MPFADAATYQAFLLQTLERNDWRTPEIRERCFAAAAQRVSEELHRAGLEGIAYDEEFGLFEGVLDEVRAASNEPGFDPSQPLPPSEPAPPPPEPDPPPPAAATPEPPAASPPDTSPAAPAPSAKETKPIAASGESRRLPIGLIIAAAVLVVAYGLGLWLFRYESDHGSEVFAPDGVAASALTLELKAQSVDFVKEAMVFSLAPSPRSETIVANGRLSRDLSVEVEAGGIVTTHVFKAGHPPLPVNVTLPFSSGDVLDYPLDRFDGDIVVRASADNGATRLPVQVEVFPTLHGVRLTCVLSGEGADEVGLDIAVRRSTSVLLLTGFAMLSLGFVAVTAFSLAIAVAFGGRKLEFAMMTWIAALLFVIPTVRNGLPGAAPLGALIDFGVFFWLQILTALAMVMLVMTWFRRRT